MGILHDFKLGEGVYYFEGFYCSVSFLLVGVSYLELVCWDFYLILLFFLVFVLCNLKKNE